MSQPTTTCTNTPSTIATNEDTNNVSMQDSPSSKTSGCEAMQGNTNNSSEGNDQNSHKSAGAIEEEIAFEEDFVIPPSFNRLINKETLRDDDHPYVFWASLCLPIPPNPVNLMAVVYNALEEFIITFADEDPNFVVFPYTLSAYKLIEDLPPLIETMEDIPDDIEEWLEYFPGAKPQKTGGDTYMAVLVGMSKPLPKVVKNLSAWMRNKCFGLWRAYLQSEQPTSLGWLLFSMQTMQVERLQEAISEAIDGIPIGLRWKTISYGSQGLIPKDQQVKALHVLVDELDVGIAKPLIMALYTSKPAVDHQFLLHIWMQLVPKIVAVLNTKGRQNVDKLRSCQKMWLVGKLVEIKTWEIELLDDKSEELGMTLCDAMMALRHPTNQKFALFHSIDKHFRDDCYVLTVLKSAESQAHAMIATILPYLLWQHAHSKSGPKASALKKWFSPTARRRADDAYWCPKDECVKNQSDEMLVAALADNDNLYWEMGIMKPPSPK